MRVREIQGSQQATVGNCIYHYSHCDIPHWNGLHTLIKCSSSGLLLFADCSNNLIVIQCNFLVNLWLLDSEVIYFVTTHVQQKDVNEKKSELEWCCCQQHYKHNNNSQPDELFLCLQVVIYFKDVIPASVKYSKGSLGLQQVFFNVHTGYHSCCQAIVLKPSNKLIWRKSPTGFVFTWQSTLAKK